MWPPRRSPRPPIVPPAISQCWWWGLLLLLFYLCLPLHQPPLRFQFTFLCLSISFFLFFGFLDLSSSLSLPVFSVFWKDFSDDLLLGIIIMIVVVVVVAAATGGRIGRKNLKDISACIGMKYGLLYDWNNVLKSYYSLAISCRFVVDWNIVIMLENGESCFGI